MATHRPSSWQLPFLTRRMLEWMLVAIVILLLALVLARDMRVLQGQTELAAVKTTVGALRTAFVLEHLRQVVQDEPGSGGTLQHNPFDLLQHYPGNYIGEMTPEQAATAPSGSWVFDPECVCVGYLPVWPEWLDSPSGDFMLWFRVADTTVPLQLTVKEAYRWQGQALD